MEVNKDEALRCLDIARRHLQNANFASARKFGNKSISLYPTPDATQFLSTVDKVEKAANATSSSSTSSSSTKTSSASSSQANASSSSASSRPQPARARSTPVVDHKPVERDYTPEQAAAVKTIRSSGGDFYKVLGVSKTATDVEIKKAYRKVALQMHPDKNGAPGADEAFKIVSKAFTVLSDPQKRAIFDQHGPDEGKSSGVNYDRANPAAHHHHRGGFTYTHGGYGDEMSPEDLFNMFFGGGGSFQSRQFGGRPGQASAQAQRQRQQQQQYFRQRQQRQRQQEGDGIGLSASNLGSLIQLLPLILLLLISVTSGLFGSGSSSSSSSNSATTDFSLRPENSYTSARHTTFRHVPYYVNEVRFMNTYFPGVERIPGARQLNVPENHIANVVNHQGVKVPYKVGPIFKRMEDNVEVAYLGMIREKCRQEKRKKDIAHNKAMGFWGADRKLWAEAQKMATPHCDIVREKYGQQYVGR
ncbi:hypothetical protein BGZ81_003871 [Podila clonocystis]|nr:hypothetical protein BGZ81_003871 [Podila clonocystis]